MNPKAVISMLLLSSLLGCSSSKPAPKPFKVEPDISAQQANEAERKAEANDPCSDQRLKNASESDRKKCDPTRDMFDNIRPQQSSQPQKQPKPKSDR